MTISAETQTTSRWPILIPSMVAMMAVANLQYAWTLFTTDLTKTMHERLDEIQWTLTFFVIAQTALFPLNSYLVDRFGPRLVLTIASVFVAIGWIGAGLANSLPWLYVAYAIGGVGAGGVYGGCIGVAMTWFPDRRGLCVGMVAGSYGFGTALTALPVAYLIEHSGYRTTFIIFGAIQGIVVLAAAQFLRMPPLGWMPPDWEKIKARVQRNVHQSILDFTTSEMIAIGSFYLIVL